MGVALLSQQLGDMLARVRRQATVLIADLDDAALRCQYHPEFSPLGWHFGHVIWQEELWVLRRLQGVLPIEPSFDRVLDSFECHKGHRGRLIPDKTALLRYGEEVRTRVLEALARTADEGGQSLLKQQHVFRFLANHEAQHVEIMTTVRRLGGLLWGQAERSHSSSCPANEFVSIRSGEFLMGSVEDPDSWDNERPVHRVAVNGFEIQKYPVNGAEWIEFVEAGGYEDERLWTASGNRFRTSQGLRMPSSWSRAKDGRFLCSTLAGVVDLDPSRPVANISWHEAVAYARFMGARLPSEAEWEYAAGWNRVANEPRRFPWGDHGPKAGDADLGLVRCLPAPRGACPKGCTPEGVCDMAGSVWEWVKDAFLPYPGFSPQAYRNYSEPWFDGEHRVARGGSFASAPEMARCRFRNWYLPHMREPALGVRLARDVR